jgi:hypothetical protein
MLEDGTMRIVGLALKQPHSVGVHATLKLLFAYTLIALAASHLANLLGISQIASG